MIIIKIWGGLGNQLFQYAFAYAMAKRGKDQIQLDMDFYSADANRKPLIRQLMLEYSEEKSTSRYDKTIRRYQQSRGFRLFQRVIDVLHLGSFRFVSESRPHFISEVLDVELKPFTYCEGYWQTPLYFDEYLDSLRLQFKPKHITSSVADLCDTLKAEASVALHIRRGDYLQFTMNPKEDELMYLLDNRYYHNAIEEMQKRIPGCTFYCFSDDLAWCKQEFGSMPMTFVGEEYGLSDIEEWYVMASCRHQIISNSTYSWWAAYLNENSDKIVLRPERWFGNRDIYPNDWVAVHGSSD